MQITPLNYTFNNKITKQQTKTQKNQTSPNFGCCCEKHCYGQISRDMYLSKIMTDVAILKQKKDYSGILNYFGIKNEIDKEDNMLIVENYAQPKFSLAFSAFKIDENELFQHIKEIKGNADFSNSNVTNLGKLQKIGKDANFQCSQVENFGDLKEIGGDVFFYKSKLTNTNGIDIKGKIYSN